MNMQISANKYIYNQQDVATVVNDFSYLSVLLVATNLQNSSTM